MSRKNGGIIGPANTPVGGFISGVAGGVWRMNDVANFVGNSQWPKAPENIDNSLRFNRSSSDTLTRTPSKDGDRQKFTISLWIKKSSLSVQQLVFSCGTYSEINLKDDGQLYVQVSNNNVSGASAIRTNRVLRDVSAWYHIVVACDTTQGTASNRLRLYINGSEETSFALDQRSAITQNMSTAICGQFEHRFGIDENTSNYYGGYLAEAVLIDGQQLDPTSFGETDTTTGIWKPKKIGQIANAGTNSFYLNFKDSSNVGKDESGLGNNFTVNNLTSIDQSTDTCVENYATLNPLTNSEATFSEGNLEIDQNGSAGRFTTSTFEFSQGKWYFECKLLNYNSDSRPTIGIAQSENSFRGIIFANNNHAALLPESGAYESNGGNAVSSISISPASNDIFMFAIDLDNLKFYAGKNGSWFSSQNPSTSSNGYTIAVSGSYGIATGANDTGSTSARNNDWQFNFGSPPFSISSGNSDANGFGNFEYSVPSGYYALNTSNLNTYG